VKIIGSSVRTYCKATTVPQLTNGKHFFTVNSHLTGSIEGLFLRFSHENQLVMSKMKLTDILAAESQWHSL